MPLEKCPSCGAKVLFIGTVCPSCQIDRANPDAEKVANLRKLPVAVEESRWRARLVNSGIICLALFVSGVWMLWSAKSFSESTTARVIPESVQRKSSMRGVRYYFRYEFVLNDRRHKGDGRAFYEPSESIDVYYDRYNPSRNRQLPPNPWPGWVLAVSGLVGTAMTCCPWHRMGFLRATP